jgi:hypothetical protein
MRGYNGEIDQLKRRRSGSMSKWQLQAAKNRLSEAVHNAYEEPQVTTLRGDDAAVVAAARKYARPTRKPKCTIVDFFRKSPLGGVALDLARSRDTGRQATCFNPWVGR